MKFRISSMSHIGTIVFLLVLVATLVMLASGQDAQGESNTNRRRNRRQRNGRNGRQRGNNGRRRGGDRFARYGCEEIHLPMCKGLVPYTHTKFPNMYNHTTQDEVYRHLDALWPYLDHSCSKNTRILACASYLPKCHGRRPPMSPCKKTCIQAKKKCSAPLSNLMGLDWDEKFPCDNLPNRRCVKPVRDQRCEYEYTNCVDNSVLSVCANLTFNVGTMPNMFGQCFPDEINIEAQYFEQLVATNCHPNLNFMLCGVFSPFCIRSEQPFTFPCRELCDEVREACEPHYRRLYHNLPWPQKMQCHRYPTSDNQDFNCVMPSEGSTFGVGK